MSTPYCQGCGRIIPKTLDMEWCHWRRLRYCDDSCRAAAGLGPAGRNGGRRDVAPIEDICFMLETGRSWSEILARLGTTLGALERRLHRAKQHELACDLHRTLAPRKRAAA
jgi:hypothetical protein